MNQKKLQKLRDRVEALRGQASNIKRRKLVALAKALGRYEKKGGKEPTYVSDRPGAYPLSIPGHSNIKKGTACKILDFLEEELDRIEDEIREIGDG